MGLLKLTPAEVLSLQDNVPERGHDLTLRSGPLAASVLARCRALGQQRPLSHYEVVDLARQNLRVVTVTMFSAHVEERAIGAALARYGTVV